MIKIIYTDPTEGRQLEMYVSRDLYTETLKALIAAGCQVMEVRSD